MYLAEILTIQCGKILHHLHKSNIQINYKIILKLSKIKMVKNNAEKILMNLKKDK
jgi:hypothetical protein